MNLRICVSLLFIIALNVLSANEEKERYGGFLPANDLLDSASLSQVTSKGLQELSVGQFENAVANFNYVLKVLHESNMLNHPLFGAALWGRLLSNAYANLEEEVFNDLFYIRSYLIVNACNSCCSLSVDPRYPFEDNYEYKIYLAADFANPKEKISPAECKNRVRGTANVMRFLVEKIPNRSLAAAINFTITELEYAAYGCCDRNHWSECLSPVVDSWEYLKNCMDKGVAIALIPKQLQNLGLG